MGSLLQLGELDLQERLQFKGADTTSRCPCHSSKDLLAVLHNGLLGRPNLLGGLLAGTGIFFADGAGLLLGASSTVQVQGLLGESPFLAYYRLNMDSSKNSRAYKTLWFCDPGSGINVISLTTVTVTEEGGATRTYFQNTEKYI